MTRLISIALLIITISGCSVREIWYGETQPLMSTIVIRNDTPVDVYGTSEDGGFYKVDASGTSGSLTTVKSNNSPNDKGDNEISRSEGTKKTTKIIKKTQGYLITWSPNFNGAFVSASGNGCIQPATVAKTKEGSLNVPRAIITGIKTSEDDVSTTYSEALTKLISVTDQSTYMSIGSYGICQLAAIGALKDGEAATLMLQLINNTVSIRSDGETKPTKPQTGTSVVVKTDSGG